MILVCPVCSEKSECREEILDDKPCAICIEDLEKYKQEGFLVLVADHQPGYEESPWLLFNSLFLIKKDVALKVFDAQTITQGVVWMDLSVADRIGLSIASHQ